jgi:S1-C subfamily serine protease
MFPRGEEKKRLRMFMPLYAIGCGLGHPPLATEGHLTGMNDVIDNYPYWLSSAPTIFGNSGGSVFLMDTLEFIGVPSRIAVQPMGFGADAITHMSYFIPVTTVYDFLEEQMFEFIYDDSLTSTECAKRRDDKRKNDEIKMAVDMVKEE